MTRWQRIDIDDAQGIAAGVGSGSTNSLGFGGWAGEIDVRDRFSVWDERDLPPDSFLKIGSSDVPRQGEFGSLGHIMVLPSLRRSASPGFRRPKCPNSRIRRQFGTQFSVQWVLS